jgi:hypothetical protein
LRLLDSDVRNGEGDNAMFRRILIAIAAVTLVPVSAEAAMVQALDAPVFVNRGSGFQPVGGTQEVTPGDLVRAGDTGRAQIIYDNGCKELVEPGQTLSVAGGSMTDDKSFREPPRCRGAAGWLLGAAAVGGIAAAIIISEDDDDRPRPVSP